MGTSKKKATSRPVRITKAKVAKFLKLLSETGNVSHCCKALNICRISLYAKRKREPELKQAWEIANEMAVGLLEDEAWRRAYSGIDKAVWYKGEAVGSEKVYSDTLLMNRLQAELPEKYQYKQKLEHSGSMDLNVKINFVKSDQKPDGPKR